MAFYGGVEKEGGLIVSNFKQLVKHQLKLLNTQWLFAMWQVRTGPLPCASNRRYTHHNLGLSSMLRSAMLSVPVPTASAWAPPAGLQGSIDDSKGTGVWESASACLHMTTADGGGVASLAGYR